MNDLINENNEETLINKYGTEKVQIKGKNRYVKYLSTGINYLLFTLSLKNDYRDYNRVNIKNYTALAVFGFGPSGPYGGLVKTFIELGLVSITDNNFKMGKVARKYAIDFIGITDLILFLISVSDNISFERMDGLINIYQNKTIEPVVRTVFEKIENGTLYELKGYRIVEQTYFNGYCLMNETGEIYKDEKSSGKKYVC